TVVPVAGPPDIMVIVEDPLARHVGTAGQRGGRIGFVFRRGWRRAEILHLLLLGRGPETRHPLPASFRLAPVAGDPFALGRRYTPRATHPQEIVFLFVPIPVAGNPLHVFAARL